LVSFGRIWLLFTYHLALSGSDHLATLATSGEGRESQWLFLSIKSCIQREKAYQNGLILVLDYTQTKTLGNC
jgi:hypothetical protein